MPLSSCLWRCAVFLATTVISSKLLFFKVMRGRSATAQPEQSKVKQNHSFFTLAPALRANTCQHCMLFSKQNKNLMTTVLSREWSMCGALLLLVRSCFFVSTPRCNCNETIMIFSPRTPRRFLSQTTNHLHSNFHTLSHVPIQLLVSHPFSQTV